VVLLPVRRRFARRDVSGIIPERVLFCSDGSSTPAQALLATSRHEIRA